MNTLRQTDPAQEQTDAAQRYRLNPAAKHCMLAVGLLITALIGGLCLNVQAEKIADNWAKELKYFSKTSQTSTRSTVESNLYINNFSTSTFAEKKRVQEQMQIIKSRATTHLTIMTYFYTRFSMSIALASASVIISAISLFYISKVGWEKANNYIITIFVTTSLAIFVGAFPIVFQQNNIMGNSDLYLKYINLENQILTRLATKANTQGTDLTLKEIINNTDLKLTEYNKIAIGFDANSIPQASDVFHKFSK